MEQKILKLLGVKGTFKKDVMPMINYSSANITTSGSGYVISLYFTLFLTGVVDLEPEYAAIVTFIAGIWDAVIDPFIGIITDRTRSKYGRHRRYILWAMPLYSVSFALLWNSYGLNGRERPMQAVVYFTIVYVLYKTAYSFVDVPHVAMLPELAPDYDLRTQYNSVGYIFNSFGMFPSFFLAMAILGVFGFSDPESGAEFPMLLVGIILALVYAVCLVHTFRKTREKPSLDMVLQKFDFKYFLQEYALVIKNKAFRQYFTMSLSYNIACNFYRSSLVFYIRYIARLIKLYGLFTTIEGVFEASAFPFNYAITMKHGKKKCANIVTPLMILGFAICLFMNPTDENSDSIIWVIILMLTAVFYPFGKSGIGYTATNIFPDISDIDEAITGRRREGVIGTFNTLIKTCVSTTVQSLVLVILGVFGLETGSEVTEYEKTTGLLFDQPDSALLGVRLCVVIVPIAFTLLSLFLLHKFQMNKSDHRLICAAIATKHKYGNVTLTAEQIKVVEQISGQKYEKMWLGQNNEGEPHTVEVNENGEYDILIEKEAEMAAIRNSKEGKTETSKATEDTNSDYNESLERVKKALGEDE
ncbi:MAG: MFS transporter [Clostridia bacterium]|nr:MFS transporter [Clostridia bacterium]